ncbi:MAG: hypothetical protein CM15mP45_16260 [Deltaproteobacteria bacterium]|nr:MAG: hypothetical protein CM15mP45_16260 [Deltaproteobacteria bacterium]
MVTLALQVFLEPMVIVEPGSSGVGNNGFPGSFGADGKTVLQVFLVALGLLVVQVVLVLLVITGQW